MTHAFVEHKKRRQSYSYEQKQIIIDEWKVSGQNINEFAQSINIKTKTLCAWIRNKDKILSINDEKKMLTKAGRKTKTILPQNIEILILEWIKNVRSAGLPVSDDLIKARGKFLIDEQKLNINCSFSNGWLSRFKKRNNICSRRGGSKFVRSDDIELNKIIQFVADIKSKIISNNYDSVINIDETAIYYDSHVDYTHDIKGTKRIEIISTGREKERITVALAVDIFNNICLKPYVILKGKTLRCLKKFTPNANYTLAYQKNAWCTEDNFIELLSQLPKDKKILLLLDNFSGHKTEKVMGFLKDNYPLVEIMLLPPNTTSILQPLDVGINKPFKTKIKQKYVTWLMDNYDQNLILPKLPKYDRTVLLLSWVNESWNSITIELIRKSFQFCGYTTTSDEDKCKWKKYFIIEK
jgi:transposase-like protein